MVEDMFDKADDLMINKKDYAKAVSILLIADSRRGTCTKRY